MPLSDYDRADIGRLLHPDANWFTAELIKLIHKADLVNRARLFTAYPEEVTAYVKWADEPMPGGDGPPPPPRCIDTLAPVRGLVECALPRGHLDSHQGRSAAGAVEYRWRP